MDDWSGSACEVQKSQQSQQEQSRGTHDEKYHGNKPGFVKAEIVETERREAIEI